MRISQAPSLDVINASVLTTQGDLVHRGAAVPERLGSVGGNFVLRRAGAGTGLQWQFNNYFADRTNIAFRVSILDIGVWDMDTDTTKVVTHGITYADIIVVLGYVERDDTTRKLFICQTEHTAGGDLDLNIDHADATTILLRRRIGGFFDNVGYSSGVMNRGRLFVITA